jgi:hypothetical protein
MLHCRDATVSSLATEVQEEVLAYFHAVSVERHNSMRIWMFGLPGRILCEQSPRCQRKWWVCSWLCSSLLSPFSISVSFDFPSTAHAFFPERLSNHLKGLRPIFPRFPQNLMHTRCRIHRQIPSGLLHDSKWKVIENQNFHPTAWNFVHWLPRYSNAIIYSCIALVQLLYRRQHQSRKLWIPLWIQI